jgi:Uncharacterized protein conserved in bacteria (DUF2314)
VKASRPTMAERKSEKDKNEKPGDFDKVGLGALGVLVVGLAFVVWLALPKESDLQPSSDGGASAVDGGEAASAKTAGTLERLGEATVELAVLSDKPEEEVAKLAQVEAIAKLLDIRHCGGACDVVKKLMLDHDHFEVEVLKSEDYILPPKDSYPTVAPGLTPSERASIGQRATTVVIRSRGASNAEQLPARAAFAATAAVAEKLSGLVYDEVVRRIETSAQFAEHTVTVPLGQNVFSPRQIMVQLYRQEDGTARLLTLGMVRFGSPDFTIRGAPMELGQSLASVINVVASGAAAGRTELPPVSLADVARLAGRPVEDLAKDPKASTPVKLETVDWERIEGDPENEMVELVPRGGATAEAWGSAMTELFGATPRIVFAGKDPELDAIATRARHDLPAAVKRFEGGDGTLYVKGPFPIPAESRLDGGASEEWMWMQVTSCDPKVCAGLLSNTPGYATNLAAGRAVTVPREKTADWMLRLADGGTTGGESIKALQKRR